MRTPSLAFVAVALLATGCNLLMPHGQPNNSSDAPKVQVTDEQKAAVRSQEAAAEKLEEQMGNAEVQQIDKMEADLVKALKFALGQQPATPGMPPPESSSNAVKGIRDAKIKLRIESVVDQDGRPVNDNFMQVKDSFTDRVQQLSRKMSEGKATPAETKEIQAGAKHAAKLNDIKMQLMNVSLVTMQANSLVQTSSMTTMLRVSGMVRTRKQMEMQLSADDYAKVQKWLERQRRIEAIAATSLGVMATYQAVINDNGEPKALDVLAESALKAFPFKASVSEAEAKDYVSNLKQNVSAVKGKYEEMMRKVHGDAKYERQYKAGIDSMFRQAEGANDQKSVSEMANDVNAKYKEDLAKCARGEAIPPGSLVGPAKCKEARAAKLEGRAMESIGEPASGAKTSSGGGLLDSLIGAIPGLSTVKASLEGVAALAKGDPKGALNAAMGMVPGLGSVKEGLAAASKSLFKS